jgi:hypothetical protein
MISKQIDFDGVLLQVEDRMDVNGKPHYLVSNSKNELHLMKVSDVVQTCKAHDPLRTKKDSATSPKKTSVDNSAMVAVLNALTHGGDFKELEGLSLPKELATKVVEFGEKKGYGQAKMDILKGLG